MYSVVTVSGVHQRDSIVHIHRLILFPVVGGAGLVAKLCPTPCDPMDCSLPGSSVRGIHQARILQRVAMPSSRGSSPLRDRTCVSCLAGGSFIAEPLGNPD